MSGKSHRNKLVATVVLSFVPALVCHLARACPETARKKILTYNKKAAEEFDVLAFQSARQTLRDARSIIVRSGCDNHMVAARTYMNLAVLHVMGFMDENRGRLMFRRALRVSKHVTLDRRVATPRLLRIFDSVKRSIAVPVTRQAMTAAPHKERSWQNPLRMGWPASEMVPATTGTMVRWIETHREFSRGGGGWTARRNPAALLGKRRISRLLYRAKKRIRQGRINAAYQTCRKAVTLAPDDIRLRVQWALIQARAGDLGGAMQTIKWLEGRISQARLRSVCLNVVKLAEKR